MRFGYDCCGHGCEWVYCLVYWETQTRHKVVWSSQQGMPLDLSSLEGGFQTGACHHLDQHADRGSTNAFHQCLSPQGEDPVTSGLSGGCSKTSKWDSFAYGLCSFDMYFTLLSRSRDYYACKLFQSKFSFSYSCIVFLVIFPVGFQNQAFGELVSTV